MKLINKDTDYAVKALLWIARKGGGQVSAAELSRELDIPHPFLRKILRILGSERIVTSSRGKGGGFALALPPEKIYLTDLIRILQGPVSLAECIFKEKVCLDVGTCPLRKKILKLQKSVILELKHITLASLLVDGGPREGKLSGAGNKGISLGLS